MARPVLTGAQAALLDALLTRVEAWAQSTPLVSRVTQATVVSVTPGAASDGSSLVVVSWFGTDTDAAYLSSYTPGANHVVAVTKTGSQLLILGRIIGTP